MQKALKIDLGPLLGQSSIIVLLLNSALLALKDIKAALLVG